MLNRFREEKLENVHWYGGDGRYVDDIFFIWNDDEASLIEFLDFAQSFSDEQKMGSTIKFTANKSREKVSFIDVGRMMKNGKISTSFYSKPRGSHLYLSQTSNHPKHIINNIPKSQFLRLRRICSETSDFMEQCNKYMKLSLIHISEPTRPY